MLFLWFVQILNVKEKWLSTEISMIESIFLYLSHRALSILAARKHVNHRDEYGLEFPTNLQSLYFNGTEQAIKLAKKVK